MMVQIRGVLTGTIIKWEVDQARLDPTSIWRAVVDVVLPHVSADARAILRSLIMGEAPVHSRIEALDLVLTGLREHAAPLLRQRIDIVLLTSTQVRVRARRDSVWVVTPTGRSEIGYVEWSEHTESWWGTMFADDARLGPHAADDSTALIERMVRRSAGLADTWMTPRVSAPPPVAAVVDLTAGGRP